MSDAEDAFWDQLILGGQHWTKNMSTGTSHTFKRIRRSLEAALFDKFAVSS